MDFVDERYEERIVEDFEQYSKVAPGIIVANDRSAVLRFKEQSRKQKAKQEEINTIKTRVENIEKQMDSFQTTLEQILTLLQNKEEN